MLYDANKELNVWQETFDLCVVGAGPAGITLACELAGSGLQVCLLDAGAENFSMQSQELYKPQAQPEFYEDTTFNRLRMLGGSSNHWENNTSEFMPHDFMKKSWIPNSGWPIGYNDIQPFYEKAALYCQTGSDGYVSEEWHDKLAKTDPLSSSEDLCIGIAKASTPPTRFFMAHGAKLISAENITIIKNANLTDIELSDSKNISSATFTNYSKKRFTINAKKYVFAMGGIENARMLLIFNEKYDNQIGNENDLVGRYFMDHPLLRAAKLYAEKGTDLGLLDGRKQVGNKDVYAFIQHCNESILKNRVINLRMPIYSASRLQLSDGVESMHVLKESLSNFELPEHTIKHLINTIKDADAVNESIIRKAFNTKVLEYVDDFEGYEMPIMFEQLPHYDNRISLGNQLDKLGLKQHIVFWKFHDEDFELAWDSLKVVASELALSKVGRLRVMKEFQERLQNEKLFVSHHHMGVTRMARSASKGVVDTDGKVFGVDNLYIAGSSVFPTGSHVPPTLTLVALTIRLAEHFSPTKEALDDR